MGKGHLQPTKGHPLLATIRPHGRRTRDPGRQTTSSRPSSMTTPTPEDPPPSFTSNATGPDSKEVFTSMRPLFELDQLAVSALEDLGVTPVTAAPRLDDASRRMELRVLHFVILPQKSVWLDFLLEADHASALKLLEAISGQTEGSPADLEDVLRETMNLIHGKLKSAFRKDGAEVIIPVVPQSLAREKILGSAGGYCLKTRLVLTAPDITLQLTMVARVSPTVYRRLRQLHLSNVLVEPLLVGEEQIVLVKQHTMLNQRMVDKVHQMAEFEQEEHTHAVIEPSPYAELINRV